MRRGFLLVVLALLTAYAAQFVAFALHRNLLPPDGTVAEAWADVTTVMRYLYWAWTNPADAGGDAPPEAVGGAPFPDELQFLGAAAVVVAALIWFLGFVFGGIAGNVLLRASTKTLRNVALVVFFLLFSTQCDISSDTAAETIRTVRAAFNYGLAAFVAGFFAMFGLLWIKA